MSCPASPCSSRSAPPPQELGGQLEDRQEGCQIANEAITSSKLAASFSSQLVRNVAYVTKTSASSSEGTETINAECPAGKEVLGGGIRINGDTEGKVVPFDSGPLLSGSARIGWTAAAREIEGGTGLSWSITAFAICAEI